MDTIIRNATLIDGTGAPAWRGDIGIRQGRIESLGNISAEGAETVDAGGKVVAPGFIDMHTHSDLTPLLDTRCSSKIYQGVTTELVGHCGFSAFPLVRGTAQARTELGRAVMMAAGIEPAWDSCAGYLDALEAAQPALNIATLVGNGTVRSAVVGYDNRPARQDELSRMRRLVAQAMEEGAFGLSSGLTLYPSSIADESELVALCEETARWGGFYDTHVRHLAGWHFKSLDEAIHIGKHAGAPIQVAHLCLIDPRHWGETDEVFRIFARARNEDVDLTYDVYPYTAAGCPFSEAMPDWVQDGGTETMLARLVDPSTRNKVIEEAGATWAGGIPLRWENVIIAWSGPWGDPGWAGKSVLELSQEAATSPEEMMIQILIRSRDVGLMIVHNRTEEDVSDFISHELGMIGSDGIAITRDGPWGSSPVHPRFYGTFPRVLGRYVRERKSMTLEEAIRKMTSLPASRLRLADRGLLKAGYMADLIIFDPANVADRATFASPHQYAAGISHVMVNGIWALRDGEQTTARPGRVLRSRR